MNEQWHSELTSVVRRLEAAAAAFEGAFATPPPRNASGATASDATPDAWLRVYVDLAVSIRDLRDRLDTCETQEPPEAETLPRLLRYLALVSTDRDDFTASIDALAQQLDTALSKVDSQLAALRGQLVKVSANSSANATAPVDASPAPARGQVATNPTALSLEDLESQRRRIVNGARPRLTHARKRLSSCEPHCQMEQMQRDTQALAVWRDLHALEQRLSDIVTHEPHDASVAPTRDVDSRLKEANEGLKDAAESHLGPTQPFGADAEMVCANVAKAYERTIKDRFQELSRLEQTQANRRQRLNELRAALDTQVPGSGSLPQALCTRRRRLCRDIGKAIDENKEHHASIVNASNVAHAQVTKLHDFQRRLHQARSVRWLQALQSALFHDPLRAGSFLYALLTVIGLVYLGSLSVKFGLGLDGFATLQVPELIVVGAQYGLLGLAGFAVSVLAAQRTLRRVLTTRPDTHGLATPTDEPANAVDAAAMIRRGRTRLDNGPRIPGAYRWLWAKVSLGIAAAFGFTVLLGYFKPWTDENLFVAHEVVLHRDGQQKEMKGLRSVFRSNSHEWFYDIDSLATYRFAREDLRCVKTVNAHSGDNVRDCIEKAPVTVTASERIAESIERFLETTDDTDSHPMTLRELAAGWHTRHETALAERIEKIAGQLDVLVAHDATRPPSVVPVLNAYYTSVVAAGEGDSALPPFMEEFRACYRDRVNPHVAIEVRFAPGQSKPTPEFDAEQLADEVRDNIVSAASIGKLRVYIVGFASLTGSSTWNLNLSKMRARKVKKLLVEKLGWTHDTGPDLRYLPLGDQWSATFVDRRDEMAAGEPESDAARAVHVFGCRIDHAAPAAANPTTAAVRDRASIYSAR